MRPRSAQKVVRLKRTAKGRRLPEPFDLKEIGFTLVSDEQTLAEIDAIHTRMLRAAQAFRRLTFV